MSTLEWFLTSLLPCGPQDVSPFGLQSEMFGGLSSQVCVLKVRMPDVDLEFFAPQDEAPILSSLPIVDTALGVGFIVKLCPCLLHILQYSFLLVCPIVIIQAAFRFFKEKIVPYKQAVDSMCP